MIELPESADIMKVGSDRVDVFLAPSEFGWYGGEMLEGWLTFFRYPYGWAIIRSGSFDGWVTSMIKSEDLPELVRAVLDDDRTT